MEERTYYKVVGKYHRYGTNATGAMNIENMSIYQLRARIKEFNIDEFFPRYRKGAIVKAVKGTKGLMVFKSRKSANQFIKIYDGILVNTKVIRVSSKDKPVAIKSIIDGCFNIVNLSPVLKSIVEISVTNAPFFGLKSLKVLE